jgi:O-antigen ligase
MPLLASQKAPIPLQTYWQIIVFLLVCWIPFGMLGGDSKLGLIKHLGQIQWGSLWIACLALLWLMGLLYHKPTRPTISLDWLLIISIFYLLHLLAYKPSQSTHAIHEITTRLPLVLLPWFFATGRFSLPMQKLLSAFVIAVWVATLLTFREGFAFILDLNSGLPKLQRLIVMHRPYLGLYVGFSMLILLSRLLTYTNPRQEKWIIGLLGYFGLFLLLIQAKMTLLGIAATLIILLTVYWIQTSRYVLAGLFWVLLLSISIGLYHTHNGQAFVQNLTRIDWIEAHIRNPDTAVQQYTRQNILVCGLQILSQNQQWLYGLGTGGVQAQLQACYAGKGFVYEKSLQLNAHNEYLQTTLRHGIIGLLLLIGVLILPLYRSLAQRQYLYAAFLLLCAFAFLTESMLSRQAGVIFFAFFNSLFAFYYLSNRIEVS